MHTYLVRENQRITPSTLLLTLQRDEQERPLAFQPGQYAAISFEHDGKKAAARCFSIVSSPTDQDILQFSMRIRGRYTTALTTLQKDDIVNVAGPFGGFVFDVPRDRQAILMAGGIGITPFISIMRYLERLNADNTVTLLYSCATQDDIPFGRELLEIQSQHPNLKTIFLIGNGPIDKLPASNAIASVISGNILDAFTGGTYIGKKFFVCGPPGFMNAVTGTLSKKGVAKGNIMTEVFTQSSPKQTSILRSWPYNVYALGAIGVILGSFVVMTSDLLKALPITTATKSTKASPFLLTNARQKQLDQLVNTIPPSASVITAPTANQQPVSSAPTTTAVPTKYQPPATSTIAPAYVAPAPRTTASAPPP